MISERESEPGDEADLAGSDRPDDSPEPLGADLTRAAIERSGIATPGGSAARPGSATTRPARRATVT